MGAGAGQRSHVTERRKGATDTWEAWKRREDGEKWEKK